MRQPAAPDLLDREAVPPEAWTRPVAMTSPPIRVETVPVRRAGRVASAARGAGRGAGRAGDRQAVGQRGQRSNRPGGAEPARRRARAGGRFARRAGPADTAVVPVVAAPVALLPGQVACDAPDWEIVTLGTLPRVAVRTWTPIAPVEASGAADPSIPDLSLGELGRRGDGRLRAVERARGQPGRRAGSSPPGGRGPRRVALRREWRLDGWCRDVASSVRARGARRRRSAARWWPGGSPITTAGERRGAGPAVPGDDNTGDGRPGTTSCCSPLPTAGRIAGSPSTSGPRGRSAAAGGPTVGGDRWNSGVEPSAPARVPDELCHRRELQLVDVRRLDVDDQPAGRQAGAGGDLALERGELTKLP